MMWVLIVGTVCALTRVTQLRSQTAVAAETNSSQKARSTVSKKNSELSPQDTAMTAARVSIARLLDGVIQVRDRTLSTRETDALRSLSRRLTSDASASEVVLFAEIARGVIEARQEVGTPSRTTVPVVATASSLWSATAISIVALTLALIANALVPWWIRRHLARAGLIVSKP